MAVIKDGVDAGGSYVFVQRWEHNLKQLNRMSVPDQEMMIGRTKDANEEIDGDERPVTSHLSRVDLKRRWQRVENRPSELPYGTASGTHGLYFCAYCARLYNIEQQLLSMFGDTDGKRDAMLRFTKPVTGGYYFAPSLERIRRCNFSPPNPLPKGRGTVRCGYGICVRILLLPLPQSEGRVRASATQALQVSPPSPHHHALQTQYSRSVKLAIPRSVASGCGVIVLAAVQFNRQPYCAAGEIENIGANGVLTAKRVASKTAVAQSVPGRRSAGVKLRLS